MPLHHTCSSTKPQDTSPVEIKWDKTYQSSPLLHRADSALPRVWYKVTGGQRTVVEVLTVDISHPPTSYAIGMPGTEVVRETEAGRLEAMSAEEKLEHSAELQPPAGASLLVLEPAWAQAHQQPAARHVHGLLRVLVPANSIPRLPAGRHLISCLELDLQLPPCWAWPNFHSAESDKPSASACSTAHAFLRNCSAA